MTKLWKWNKALALALTIFFLVVDLSFFSANIIKVPDGGWFPLVIGGLIYYMMSTWYKGKRMMNIQLHKVTDPIRKFVTNYKQKAEHTVKGTAIYLASNPENIPPTLVFNLRHNKILHENIIILTVKYHPVPFMNTLDNAEIKKLEENMYHVTISYGYMDNTDIPKTLELINNKDLKINGDTTYFLGRESVVITKNTGMHPLRENLFEFMSRNSVRATRYFNLPNEKVFEIGSQIRL